MIDEFITKDNETKGLTIDKLREFKGYEKMNDDEASEMVSSMNLLSRMLFDSFEKHVFKTI